MDTERKSRDYFAEMYVAGISADKGWNVYFPRRDKGFDFVITKVVGNRTVLRPVQVKGKYPKKGKTNKSVYGYMGKLSELHDDIVLAIPFFSDDHATKSPEYVAYVPRSQIKPQASRGFQCQPAKFNSGRVVPRESYERYFDAPGIQLMESEDWR